MIYDHLRRRVDLRGQRYSASYNGRLDKFLADNAPKLEPNQEVHLHAIWYSQSGKVIWHAVTKGSVVCSFPGRCMKAKVS